MGKKGSFEWDESSIIYCCAILPYWYFILPMLQTWTSRKKSLSTDITLKIYSKITKVPKILFFLQLSLDSIHFQFIRDSDMKEILLFYLFSMAEINIEFEQFGDKNSILETIESILNRHWNFLLLFSFSHFFQKLENCNGNVSMWNENPFWAFLEKLLESRRTWKYTTFWLS